MSKIIDKLKENRFKTIEKSNVKCPICNGDLYTIDNWMMVVMDGNTVNMELFKETIRAKNLRPVWIFKGKSNSGKSFLASKLNDLEVYETDSNDNLPTSITASIVVLGNKYNYSIDDIKSKLFGEVEVQIVEFQ